MTEKEEIQKVKKSKKLRKNKDIAKEHKSKIVANGHDILTEINDPKQSVLEIAKIMLKTAKQKILNRN